MAALLPGHRVSGALAPRHRGPQAIRVEVGVSEGGAERQGPPAGVDHVDEHGRGLGQAARAQHVEERRCRVQT